MTEVRRWRKVACDECGAEGRELMAKREWTAYLDEEWVWLCKDCWCEGDGNDD